MSEHKIVNNVKSEDLWNKDLAQFEKELFYKIDKESSQLAPKINTLNRIFVIAAVVFLMFATDAFLKIKQEEDVLKFVYEVTSEATEYEFNEDLYTF